MQTETLLGTTLADAEPLKLMEQLAAGLPAETLRQFKRAARLGDDELARLLQVGGRTLSRLKASRSRLPPDLSDRLYAVAALYAIAEDVLGDSEQAHRWLEEPQYGLAGRRPREMLSTDVGRREVRQLLMRLEHGFLA
jgi:putative toxin-antitoxin system antitoxin component (TIGR02293 family)